MTQTANAISAAHVPSFAVEDVPGTFDRGRVQLEGKCGCGWSAVEVNPPAEADYLTATEVASRVALHARTYGHAPTFTEIRESYYRSPA